MWRSWKRPRLGIKPLISCSYIWRLRGEGDTITVLHASYLMKCLPVYSAFKPIWSRRRPGNYKIYTLNTSMTMSRNIAVEDREYRVEIEEMMNDDDEERRCNRKMLISLWDSDGVDGHFVRVFGQSRVPGTVFIESLFHLKNYKKSNVSRCHQ